MYDGDPEGGARSDGSEGAPAGAASRRRLLSGLLDWLRRRRRMLIAILCLVAFFYLLGRFSSPVTTSGMCLVYG